MTGGVCSTDQGGGKRMGYTHGERGGPPMAGSFIGLAGARGRPNHPKKRLHSGRALRFLSAPKGVDCAIESSGTARYEKGISFRSLAPYRYRHAHIQTCDAAYNGNSVRAPWVTDLV